MNHIPERGYIEARIDRCYTRMMTAKSDGWRHAWADALVANCSARNAMRSVAELRNLERARGLG